MIGGRNGTCECLLQALEWGGCREAGGPGGGIVLPGGEYSVHDPLAGGGGGKQGGLEGWCHHSEDVIKVKLNTLETSVFF